MIYNIYTYIRILNGNWRSSVDLVLENHWPCPIHVLQNSMQKLRSIYHFFAAMSVIHADDFIILADLKVAANRCGR